MSDYLCVRAVFLTGRYHGREWPPAPARLMRALLAGAMTGRYRDRWPLVEGGFRWLEGRQPPIIVADKAMRQTAYGLAVPNNDLDVVAKKRTKADGEDRAAKLLTIKTAVPWQSEEPHQVHYIWPVSPADVAHGEAVIAGVESLAQSMHTLGWGIDMAYAQATLLNEDQLAGLSGERWYPSATGSTTLQVPVEGFLDDLRDTHRRFCGRLSPEGLNPDVRARVYGEQAYRKEGGAAREWIVFTLKTPGGEQGFSVSWRQAMVVAAWLRHAAAEALREEHWDAGVIDSYVLGHAATGEAPGNRLSFLPLPSIGHSHGDGRVRRVAIAEPLGCQTDALRLLSLKLPVSPLTDEAGQPVCRLARPASGERVVQFYRWKAKQWRTVTPLILHGHNAARGRHSPAKTERLLLQAFEAAGYPERLIAGLAFQPAPYWAGCGGITAIRVPRHLDGWPRYHVTVEFREAVEGPIAAGLGRHYGLGLFAAKNEG